MRSKNYGINVRVTEQEKQTLLENARFCYRLFRMLNGLKTELPQLQKEEILSRLEAILNELK